MREPVATESDVSRILAVLRGAGLADSAAREVIDELHDYCDGLAQVRLRQFVARLFAALEKHPRYRAASLVRYALHADSRGLDEIARAHRVSKQAIHAQSCALRLHLAHCGFRIPEPNRAPADNQ